MKPLGFTLIELMIVIAIIGILAAIALPAYQTYTRKSHVLEGVNLANGAKTAIWDYWSTSGGFPTSNSSAGINETITGNSVKSLIIAEKDITITYNDKVINNATLIFRADDSGLSTLEWSCTNGTLLNKYRPISCR